MGITLGGLVLDGSVTAVREEHAEIGGKECRRVEISGLVLGEATLSDVEDRLDAILAAASAANHGAELCLREGRRMHVRRAAFTREVLRDALAGSFKVVLETRDSHEESEELHCERWEIDESGAAIAVTTSGNACALPEIALVASGAVVSPSFSDGERTVVYRGTVSDGAVLVFDASARSAFLGEEDVTPYVEGEFPRITPEGTALAYSDDPTSTHTASVTVTFRDRWW